MKDFLKVALILLLGSVLIGPVLSIGFFLLGGLFKVFLFLFLIGSVSRLFSPFRWNRWWFW